MISVHIYSFLPLFANGVVALAIMFKLYKRAMPAFSTFIATAIVTNMAYYGLSDEATALWIIFMVCLLTSSIILDARKEKEECLM